MGAAYTQPPPYSYDPLHRFSASETEAYSVDNRWHSGVCHHEVHQRGHLQSHGSRVSQGNEGAYEPLQQRPVGSTSQGIYQDGVVTAGGTGTAVSQDGVLRLSHHVTSGPQDSTVLGMEDSISMGRHGQSSIGREFSSGVGGGNRNSLQGQDENIGLQPASHRVNGDSTSLYTNEGGSGLSERTKAKRGPYYVLHSEDRRTAIEVASDTSVDQVAQGDKTVVHSAQHKKGRDKPPMSGFGSGAAGGREANTANSKASGPAASVPNINVQVRRQYGSNSKGAGFAERHNTAMKEREALMRQLQDRRLRVLTSLASPFKKASSRLPSTVREKEAPLHVRIISTWNRDRLLELARETPYYEELARALRYCYDETLYEDISTGEDVFKGTRSHVSNADLKLLVEAGILRKVAPGTVKRTGRLFTIYEEGKHRRRLIQWPNQLNDEIREHFDSNIRLSSVVEQCAQVLPGMHVICHDLTISYYQGELAEEVQPYYGVMGEDGTEYVATRMVMGGVPFAEVNDYALKVLAYTDDPSVTTITHIDNLRYVGPKAAVLKADQKFKERVSYVGAVINNDELTQPHQEGVFCGIRYNAKKGQVFLADKTAGKLEEARAKMLAGTPSNEDVFTFFGLLLWASAVLRAPMQKYYMAIKFIRRRMSQVAKREALLADQALVWPSALPHFRQWFAYLKHNAPVTPLQCQTERNFVVFTDASKSGYGGVLVNTHSAEVEFTAGQWTVQQSEASINELELKAVALVLDQWAEKLDGRHVHLRVDNTTAKSSLKRGRSDHLHLNDLLLKTIPLVQRMASFTVDYVRSEENVADPLSRGQSGDVVSARRTAELLSAKGLGARSIV
jgi:hypothetical protein